MNICHVLFDMKAGMCFPGLYALSDRRSWSRGYVCFYLGFLGFYLIFYELYSFVIKIKCSKNIPFYFICGFYNILQESKGHQLVNCWELNSIGAGGMSRKDGWLTPMSSFDVGQGGH